MSRKVYITSEMSTDERLLDVAEQDQLAALIWPWILTTFDDWGRAEAKPKKLKMKIFPGNEMVSADSVDKALHLYHENGLIQLYEVDDRPYMAIPHEKWFKYQTHIRKAKREVDESKYPAPPIARDCAQVRDESRENTPSPSTLPPFTFYSNDDDKANEKTESTEESRPIGIKAVNYLEEAWGRGISPMESQSITKWCDDFYTRGSPNPDAIVIEAIKRAMDQNVRKLAYVNKILQDWFEHGVIKLEHLKELDENYKKHTKGGKKSGTNQGDSKWDNDPYLKKLANRHSE